MVLSSLSSSESTVYRLMSISDVRIVYEEVKVYNIVYRAMYIMGRELLPSNNTTQHGIRKSRNDVFDCGAISKMVLPWRVQPLYNHTVVQHLYGFQFKHGGRTYMI